MSNTAPGIDLMRQLHDGTLQQAPSAYVTQTRQEISTAIDLYDISARNGLHAEDVFALLRRQRIRSKRMLRRTGEETGRVGVEPRARPESLMRPEIRQKRLAPFCR